MAALLKKKKRYQETDKEYFTVVEMIVKEQYLIPDYAKPSPPSTPQTHTHQQFSSRRMQRFSYHTTAQKEKEKIYSISLESSHKPNSTVPIFNKSKKSIQT